MIKLERMETSDQGTFGRLIAPEFTLFTGELPWRNNQNDISCIPPGIYHCAWTFSDHFKRFMYAVTEVSGRAGIRIHPANLMGDASLGLKCQLNGCVALGEKLGWMDGQKAVLLSEPAVRRFQTFMKNEPFDLEVIDGAT